ncbi:SLU7 [Symbiodinium natans]|uniref:Pre-mRNA-splicing factor SLU7 n=1 Tax=Symbiodinium natans TaxID=878477 RepID=A0A812LGD3_9DINO|nr:SLU7 [Symbiodinium natans]
MAEASPPAADLQPSGARLLESTLYKEDVFTNEHTSVWGSFYDPETKRWGYGCCKVMEKQSKCTAEKAPEPEPNSSDLDNSPESLGPDEVEIIDWNNPPAELRPRGSFKAPTAWVEHYVRHYVGEWQRKAEDGYAGFPDLAVTTLKPLLKPSMEALEILIRRLHNPRELDRSEKTVRRGRETRAGMEGRVQEERSVLEQLDDITSNSASLDYLAARAGYMKLTLGNKTWNNTFVAHVAACTMKGAREYRRNRDNYNTYDMDPDSQKYMHALLKLVQLAQCLKPNPDQSKNCVF